MTRIYTRHGDGGRTSLFDGSSVEKSFPRVAAYGDVDELNAALGLARSLLPVEGAEDVDEALARIQADLFALGALLADPRRDGESPASRAEGDRLHLGAADIERLERRIDAWEAELPALRQFVLPTGAPAASALHLARTIARRAERAVVALGLEGPAQALGLVYLNRLSDLLFVAARIANRRVGVPDAHW